MTDVLLYSVTASFGFSGTFCVPFTSENRQRGRTLFYVNRERERERERERTLAQMKAISLMTKTLFKKILIYTSRHIIINTDDKERDRNISSRKGSLGH